jgi:FtsP/CotA-like multicopper oxidase with cupredoxin domain
MMTYVMKHRRERRRVDRRLEFSVLEPRMLLATVFIPPDAESDGTLLEPPIIESVNGVLKANVDVVQAGYVSGSSPSVLYGGKPAWSNPNSPPDIPGPNPGPAPHFPLLITMGYQFTTADGTVYPAQYPGPTLHVQPGDTLDLTIHNSLGTPASPFPVDPNFLVTNLHTHGLEVSPIGDADNPYRVLNPGETMHTVIKIPDDAAPGIDWYHPHHHMATADQVNGGLAGALIVGDPLDLYPQYKGQFNERVLALSTPFFHPISRVQDDPAPPSGPFGTQPLPQTTNGTQYDVLKDPDGSNGGYTWRKYVNGEFFPSLTLRPGQTEIWNIGGFQRNGTFNLGLTDANGQNPWSATILAYDGDGLNALPKPIKLTLPANPSGTNPFTPDLPMTVDPGARVTVAVTAPLKPGTYYLFDNYTFANLPYFDPSDSTFKSFAIAKITVTGDPVTTPPPVFAQTGAIPDIYSAIPDNKRTFSFEVDKSGKIFKFTINGTAFPNGPIIMLQAGQVEEWNLVNPSNVDHPFHIHQTDFAVISINGQPVNTQGKGTYPYVSLRDTVNIPAGGNVVIRFRVTPILGKYVFHCHILAHEDNGMMLAVLVDPDAEERRVAVGSGPNEGGNALVQNGDGATVGAIAPLPKGWKGGVATATGDLNGDLVQDIVAGPASRGARGFVTIYDGQTLKPIRRFMPFPESPRSGVSLAIGYVDGTPNGNIIVARVGPGPSLVRVFRPDGTLWRELKGVLPGRFPNGVTVASSDFNGDNFDDIAIGAGKGSKPLVMGIDGFALGDPNGSRRVPLFSFIAPGNKRAGVNLAAGYYDPRTRPGFLANLITAPQAGKGAGTVSVWLPVPSEPSAMVDGGMVAMAARADAPSLAVPKLMATLHPQGPRAHRCLSLAVTRLGKQGLDALAAWSSKRQPVYTSINDAGVVSTIRTPLS